MPRPPGHGPGFEVRRQKIIDVAAALFARQGYAATSINELGEAVGLAKGALWLLTQYMAREWGPGGVRANAFNPGLIATGENADQVEEAMRARGTLTRTPLGRMGRNRECIGAVVYLASDESSFTTGQQITVNGGVRF